jgi:hypothetical protein
MQADGRKREMSREQVKGQRTDLPQIKRGRDRASQRLDDREPALLFLQMPQERQRGLWSLLVEVHLDRRGDSGDRLEQRVSAPCLLRKDLHRPTPRLDAAIRQGNRLDRGAIGSAQSTDDLQVRKPLPQRGRKPLGERNADHPSSLPAVFKQGVKQTEKVRIGLP